METGSPIQAPLPLWAGLREARKALTAGVTGREDVDVVTAWLCVSS